MYESTFSNSSASSIEMRLSFEPGADGHLFDSSAIPTLLHGGITTFGLSVGCEYTDVDAGLAQDILRWLGTHCPNITCITLPIELHASFYHLFSGPFSLNVLIIRPPISSMPFSAIEAAANTLSELLRHCQSRPLVRLTLPLELGQRLLAIIQDIDACIPTLRELTFDIGNKGAYPDAIIRARLFGALADLRGRLSFLRFPSEFAISTSPTECVNLEVSLQEAVGPRAGVNTFHP